MKLHELGVRILRFNFTHFTTKTATPVIEMINQINVKLSEPFQLMMDIE
jgi:pyruvate kinase